MLQVQRWSDLDAATRREVLRRPAGGGSADLASDVAAIIADVRARGDAAVRDCARRFDGVDLEQFAVPGSDIAAASEDLTPKQLDALRTARDNIRAFHETQRFEPAPVSPTSGVVCESLARPLGSVGLYVPGGTAPLPSTVLMLAVPAAVAGVRRRALVTPPQADGRVDRAVLAAAYLCDIDEVYAVGGVQAVAALAYGTESIAPVDKIFGPGNAWVTEAKVQVSDDPAGAAIDLPAGPSELLVVADEGADAGCVAADLLSQAEHGADSQVLLVTTSVALADAVATEVQRRLENLPRRELAAASMSASRALVVDSLDAAIAVSNEYAPEHLVLAVESPRELLDQVTAAGSVFLGYWTPETLGDYCTGTNHVLPTAGFARTRSGLRLADFQRHIQVQSADAEGLRALAETATTLARLEGLEAHALAVEARERLLEQGGRA